VAVVGCFFCLFFAGTCTLPETVPAAGVDRFTVLGAAVGAGTLTVPEAVPTEPYKIKDKVS
jgi:hypothetical protein